MKLVLLSIFLLNYGILCAQSTSNSMLVNNSNTFAEPLILAKNHATLVYPNPTANKISLIIDKEYSSMHLKVVNTMGQTMLAKLEVEGQDYTFDLVNLPRGTYYILITIDGQTESVPVLKE